MNALESRDQGVVLHGLGVLDGGVGRRLVAESRCRIPRHQPIKGNSSETVRSFTVSFYRLVTGYPASTFSHYLASNAAIEDAEAMEDYTLVSRLKGVHDLALPFSIMCDEILPRLRHEWIWKGELMV